MSLQGAFQNELQTSPVPTLLTDSEFIPLCWNSAANQLLPGLVTQLPLPEQLPSVMWLTVPSSLRLMRAATISLSSAGGKVSLTMFPIFENGSLTSVACIVSPATGPAQDPSYAMALHDLSTPIASINSCTDLLMGHLPEQQLPYLQIIRRSTLHIQRILSGIATSMDAATALSRSGVDLPELVQTTAEQMRPILYQHTGLTLVVAVEGHPVAHCNGAQMERVLLNLLSNAIKFARSGITVTVRQGGETALIAVENDGPDIPLKDLPHIFTPWFTSGGAQPGSGLGLCVVDQITRINGGRVDVESGSGRTCFLVSLPAASRQDLSAGRGSYLLAQSRYAILYELELSLKSRSGPRGEISLF